MHSRTSANGSSASTDQALVLIRQGICACMCFYRPQARSRNISGPLGGVEVFWAHGCLSHLRWATLGL